MDNFIYGTSSPWSGITLTVHDVIPIRVGPSMADYDVPWSGTSWPSPENPPACIDESSLKGPDLYRQPWTDNTQELQLPCCARCLHFTPNGGHWFFGFNTNWDGGSCAHKAVNWVCDRDYCTKFLPGDIAPTL